MESNDYIFTTNGDECDLILCKRNGVGVQIPSDISLPNGRRYTVVKLIPNLGLSRHVGGIFENPDIVKEIFIPASVKVLGYGCFTNCRSLEKVSFEDGCVLTEVGTNVFNGCSSLRTCVLPITHATSINEYDIKRYVNIRKRYVDDEQ